MSSEGESRISLQVSIARRLAVEKLSYLAVNHRPSPKLAINLMAVMLGRKT